MQVRYAMNPGNPMANETTQNPPPPAMNDEQIITQFAQIAGLDPSNPAHQMAVAKTLQVASGMGMDPNNEAHLLAIVGVIKESARLDASPQDKAAVATQLGMDGQVLAQVEAAKQQSQQMATQLAQMQERGQSLLQKLGSRQIITWIMSLVGAVGGWFATQGLMKKFWKDDLKKITKDDKEILDFNPEKGKTKRMFSRAGGIIGGSAIIGFLTSLFTTRPIESELQQLKAQSIDLQDKKNQLIEQGQGQQMAFEQEFTQRLLVVAMQQIEQKQAALEKQTETQPSVQGQAASGEASQAPIPSAPPSPPVVRGQDVEEEIRQGQLPSFENQGVVVKPQTGAELNATSAIPAESGQSIHMARAPKPQNYTAAVASSPANQTLQLQ